MSELPRVECFLSSTNVMIYRLPMRVFSDFIGYSYLILGVGVPTVLDCGSGFGTSTQDWLAGFQAVQDDFGEKIALTDIQRIIVSHGHIDHFGGLSKMLELTEGASVGVHPLDRRILTNFEERRTVATKDLTIFLERAGVREERLKQMIDMYNFSKQQFRSVDVDFMVEEGQVLDGMEFFHVPGHCSGQVAIRIGDIFLGADHILSRTSPHVAAESITNWTGLAHYRESLRKIRKLEGIRYTLSGHEDVIEDLHRRIDAIQERIDEKLRWVMDIINNAGEPLSISEISKRRYKGISGFDVLLALQEAGAYVEYLYDRGYLGIANLNEVEEAHNPILLYSVIS